MSPQLPRVVDRLAASRLRFVGILGAVLLFLFGVRLLGASTNAAAPTLERAFVRIAGDASALGLGWLGAYALANGSIVAAVALSLFVADLLTPAQLLLLVAGSRLGAAAVVVVVGVLDHLQNEAVSLRQSVDTGVLTFLVTHSVYLPATLVGYLGLPYFLEPLRAVSAEWTGGVRLLGSGGALTAAVLSRLGPAASVALSVGLLFGSLQLFDRLLASADTRTLRRKFAGRFRRTWVAFLVGLLVTTGTTSVAFSLGVVVPLHNRGYVVRDELVPYVLGANVGTLFDTLVVAAALASPVGVAVVLELLGTAALVTLAALAVHGPYARFVVAVDERLRTDWRLFVAFALALIIVPLALLVVPLGLA